MSFYAMAFFPSFENQVSPSGRRTWCIRSLKLKGYRTEQAARKAIERRKLEGYVKQLGSSVPIWSNVNP